MKTSLFQKQNDYSSYTLDDRDGENFRCDLLRKKRKFFFYQKLFRFSLNLNPSKIYTSATITIPIYLHRSYISSHPWITLAHIMTQLKIMDMAFGCTCPLWDSEPGTPLRRVAPVHREHDQALVFFHTEVANSGTPVGADLRNGT